MGFRRLFIYIFLISLATFPSLSKAENADARMMVHLLDYIAVDYSMAVKGGQVISADEFGEMQEFAIAIEGLSDGSSEKLNQEITDLKKLIGQKASVDQVAELARSIKQKIIKQYNLAIAPKKWPSLKNGKNLYLIQCQTCHGETGRGDGQLAKGLNPAPTNFHEADKANGLSPFQAYNTIKLGVANTGMRAFSELSEDQLWDLAFYIISLPHQGKGINSPKEEAKALFEFDLTHLSSKNNEELMASLQGDIEKSRFVSASRLYPKESSSLISVDYISKAKSLIQQSEQAYFNGDFDEARSLALSAYLEGVEPIEMHLSANDASSVSELEGQLSKMRAAIESRAKQEIVKEEAKLSLELLDNAAEIIDNSTFSSLLTFTLSSTIILREGLEAFLVIITMLGIIRALKLPGAARWVHGGWVAALVSGFLMWLAADSLFSFSGAQREIMEGFIALFAVIILLYVGFWMHSKSEAGKWQAYVKNKIQRLASKENMIGLAFLSFIVVFREAFESVLFLSALSSEAGSTHNGAFIGGIVVAFLALILISVLLLKFSKRVPITKLFRYSAIIIAALSFVLVGKGFHALQEAGFIGITNTPFNLRIDLLGIYPTWQTIVAQGLVLGLIIVLWKIGNRPLSAKPAAS